MKWGAVTGTCGVKISVMKYEKQAEAGRESKAYGHFLMTGA